MNLDFDDNLGYDKEAFGISSDERPIPPKPVVSTDADATPSTCGVKECVALAQEACMGLHEFYSWCEDYLSGCATDDKEMWRYLKRLRNGKGAQYYRNGGNADKAVGYYAVCCAMAALRAVKYGGVWVERCLWYAAMVSKEM